MTVHVRGLQASLEGSWALGGVIRNLDTLSLSLQQLEPGIDNHLLIDCGQIKETDISGLQVLKVWMQCARFRGVEPTLVNIPEKLKHDMEAYCRQSLTDHQEALL